MTTTETVKEPPAVNFPDKDARRPERIMLAAWELHCLDIHKSEGQFTLEDLVVKVWSRGPEEFGLLGYEHQYPDNKIIEAHLYGKTKGLIYTGLLEKRYTEDDVAKARASGKRLAKKLGITERGKIMVRRILGEVDTFLPRKTTPPRYDRKVLDRVFNSRIFTTDKPLRDVTFSEACEVFEIKESDKPDRKKIDGKIKEVKESLNMMVRDVVDYQMRSGKIQTTIDATAALRVIEHLEDRFDRHFNLLCNRFQKKG